uniref:Uncharacterized protein n=1 Tax=mine drainage metagenome TaxID=410659 RepID=E6QX49_9ZZZZ
MSDSTKPSDQPEFDPEATSDLLPGTASGLLKLLEKKRAARTAASPREFALRSVRGLEPILQQLFDEGVGTLEVLAFLTSSLPTIPIADMKYALESLRGRRRRLRVTPSKSVATKTNAELTPDKPAELANPKQRARKPATSRIAHTPTDLPSWADGSDQRPDESDEDYRLRKEIEGPPEARHKFIGEHNT